MARYVLLEFDDNTEADNFVEILQEGTLKHNAGTGSMRAVGVFFKPTQFCECASPGDKQARGKKFNLYIHRDCGKPLRGHVQHPRNLLIPQDVYDKLRPQEKAAFYLGIKEGVSLPWLGRE